MYKLKNKNIISKIQSKNRRNRDIIDTPSKHIPDYAWYKYVNKTWCHQIGEQKPHTEEELRNNSWKPEFVSSFNMGNMISVNILSWAILRDKMQRINVKTGYKL